MTIEEEEGARVKEKQTETLIFLEMERIQHQGKTWKGEMRLGQLTAKAFQIFGT